MHIHRRTLLALALATGLTAPSLALAEDTIKLGILATFEGAFTVLGEDGMRGAMLAIEEANGMAGGKKIEIVKGSSDASPDSAVRAVRKLVEQDGVKVVVGPLSGDEGIAVNNDFVETIIALPPNLFYGTSISVTILVLSKKKTDTKIQFIDASGEDFFEKSNQ